MRVFVAQVAVPHTSFKLVCAGGCTTPGCRYANAETSPLTWLQCKCKKGSGSPEVRKQGRRVKVSVGEQNTHVVGALNCQVEVCCGDCRAFGLGSQGGVKENNRASGKLTEAPAVFLVLVAVWCGCWCLTFACLCSGPLEGGYVHTLRHHTGPLHSVSLFFCRAEEACEAPRPHGPPICSGAFGRA